MKYLYCRVSSKKQHLSRQLVLAKKYSIPTENIYAEKISGATIKHRPKIQNLLMVLKPKDIVYVMALDRLGRNMNDIKTIIHTINRKGATLVVLDLPSFKGVHNAGLRMLLDDLVVDIFSWEAEAERKQIKKRQRQGIIQAKKNGKYHGRKRKFHLDDDNVKSALSQYFHKNDNHLSTVQIARLAGMSTPELYKLIVKAKKREIRE